MKRYNKIVLSALLFSGFAFTACQDESGFESIKIVPGEEIIFGATAHFEDGNSANTRTIYGNEVTDDEGKGQIEVNWKYGDKIQIASPHTRPDIPIAEYMVGASDDATLEQEGGSGLSSVTELQRIGDAGLQWTEEDEYEFYAVYPSINQAAEVISELKESDEYGLKEENGAYTFTGYLPTVQDPVGFQRVYTAIPDMRFAYMVAQEHYKAPSDREINSPDEQIQLPFSSLTTALEFDITANVIGKPNTAANYGNIVVTDLTLYSSKGNNICGKFKYTFPQGENKTIKNGKLETLNTSSGYNSVSMSLGNGVSLTQGDAVRATFFLLPIVEEYLKAQDLKLIIHYTVNGFMQTKTATINRDIYPRTKYHFKNMVLPPITEEINASVWFEALYPQAYTSQVSFPVAGNVFANATYGAPANNYQQGKTLDELWNMGVRGFEIVTQSTGSASGDLGGCQVMAAEEFCTGSGAYTFHKAFNELVSKLKQYPNETLIILATYMAKNDGYNPYAYVSNLFNYLQGYVDKSGGYEYSNTLKMNDFVQITDTSTVAGIRGKIAIIVRPGDDERWGYEPTRVRNGLSTKDNPCSPYFSTNLALESYPTDGLTNKIPNKISSDWWDRVMCVWDWGASSYDVWDRRYGSDYARAATFNDKALDNDISGISAKKQIEKYLYASNRTAVAVGTTGNFTHSGNSNDNNFNNYGADPTTMPSLPNTGFNYEHALSNGRKAFVQEWMRVIPDGGIGPICVVQHEQSWTDWTQDYSIWAKWPSSIQEKKDAIKTLFNQSVLTKGGGSSNLYINVLSGYYATPNVNVSLLPFKSKVLTSRLDDYQFTSPGKGGDFQGLAFDLNTYVYDLLSTTPGQEGGLTQDGPWGLVVMDHIGNPPTGKEDVSQQLVNLIMMNNFKFPLATAPVNVDEGGNGGTDPAVAEVTFNDSPVDPKAEIY